MKKEKIEISISSASRYTKSNKKEGFFYFELRTGDSAVDTIIEDCVFVNNEGSLEASRDILADAISLGLITNRKEGIFFRELWDIYETVI